MSDIISAPVALTSLAQAFDRIAQVTHGLVRNRATKSAAQLRYVAQQNIIGSISTEDAWMWADTAVGQLLSDKQQLAKKARQR